MPMSTSVTTAGRSQSTTWRNLRQHSCNVSLTPLPLKPHSNLPLQNSSANLAGRKRPQMAQKLPTSPFLHLNLAHHSVEHWVGCLFVKKRKNTGSVKIVSIPSSMWMAKDLFILHCFCCAVSCSHLYTYYCIAILPWSKVIFNFALCWAGIENDQFIRNASVLQ